MLRLIVSLFALIVIGTSSIQAFILEYKMKHEESQSSLALKSKELIELFTKRYESLLDKSKKKTKY